MTHGRCNRIVRGCLLLVTLSLLLTVTFPAHGQAGTGDTGFYYTVQKGDTLWDISKKFFDSPKLWPDLWGKNGEIQNPHWIYPGARLHIYQRGGKVYVEEITTASGPMPGLSEPPYFLYPGMDQVGFIRNPEVAPSGVIFKALEDKKMVSTGDTVYIRQEGKAALPTGGRFTVYRAFHPPKDPGIREMKLGTQHYLVGVVEITHQEGGYVRATVLTSYRPINVDDQVMPYEGISPKIPLPGTAPQATGTLLFTEDRLDLIGDNVVAFIDKGKEDGVKAGDQYGLYYQEKGKISPEDKKGSLLPELLAGSIVVLRTEAKTATVLVLRSSENVKPGSKFGPMTEQ